MGRLARLAAGAFAAGVVVAVLAVAIGLHLYTRPGPLTADRTVVVESGTGLRGIAAQLEQAGVIEWPLLFAIAARLEGEPLKAGEYVFPAAISTAAAVGLMQSGRTVVRRFTVPEGWTSLQVVLALREVEALRGEVEEIPPEGSLLPETYHYSLGDSRAEMIRRMQAAMRRTVEELWETRAPDLPIASPEEAVILASIVERETGVAHERPEVAAVFVNRLRRGMRLQSDPTVIYGLSDGLGTIERGLTRKDLATEHPYNTYVIAGLPPAPIANPGAAALAAVLRPADSDHLYFVADGSGGHAFARTLAEHNRNVARWRQIERERGLR